eukprot:642507-Rhodomonas_salina.3
MSGTRIAYAAMRLLRHVRYSHNVCCYAPSAVRGPLLCVLSAGPCEHTDMYVRSGKASKDKLGELSGAVDELEAKIAGYKQVSAHIAQKRREKRRKKGVTRGGEMGV